MAVQRPVCGLPRHERVCKVCNTVDAVEDSRDFLLECPAYGVLRQRHPLVFDPWPSTPAAVFNHPDLAAVASVIYAMLRGRAEALSPPPCRRVDRYSVAVELCGCVGLVSLT